MPSWNMNATFAKDFRQFLEQVFATLTIQFIKVFNHLVLNDPYLDLSDPADFGVLGSNDLIGGQANTPRQITFNLRLSF
jgi:hypothetical protein